MQQSIILIEESRLKVNMRQVGQKLHAFKNYKSVP